MDFQGLFVVLARDGQVVPRDGRNADCLGGGDVGLLRLRLVVIVGHERLENTTF